MRHQTDLNLLPSGKLIYDDLTGNNGEVLLSLLNRKLPQDALAARYWSRVFSEHLRRLCEECKSYHSFNLENLPEFLWSDEVLAKHILSAPTMIGGEYVNVEWLRGVYQAFDVALLTEMVASQSSDLLEYVRASFSSWHNIGKLSFHLAENKDANNQNFPFAFMVSFIYMSESQEARHLPLSAALKAYVHDKKAMKLLLSPFLELAKQSSLIQNLLESKRIFRPSLWTADEAYTFFKEIPLYESQGILVRVVNLWKRSPAKAQVSLVIDAKDKRPSMDADMLLSYSLKISLNGEELTSSEIEQLLQKGDGLIRLRGQWVDVRSNQLNKLMDAWQVAVDHSQSQGVSLIDGLRLLGGMGGITLSEDEKNFFALKVGSQLSDLLTSISSSKTDRSLPLPQCLSGILRPYQESGVSFLYKTAQIGWGSCLADDMGLGKTLQILALLAIWKKEGMFKKLPALLILPASLLSNWQSEALRFTPDIKLLTLHPGSMDPSSKRSFKQDACSYLSGVDVVLTTYGMVMRNPCLNDLVFPVVIADEAQAIKSPTSKQSRAVRALQATRRIALTGTPVENNLGDLWSLFDFINPGLLGTISGFQKFVRNMGSDFSSLRQMIQPFILRRLKSDRSIIADLPDKTELKVYCSLTKRQAALYEHNVRQMKEAFSGEVSGIKRKGLVLAYLMSFKQLCNHESLYLGRDDFSHKGSGKYDRLRDIAEIVAAKQEKMIVFTQFREMTKPLHDFLTTCFGREGLILHGGVPVKQRSKLVDLFQDETGPPFFVISLKAGGVGLNLTAANHVVHFDRWWNPSVENQASDRAYRIGQKRNVLIHQFVTQGTLEESIDLLIDSKKALADDILSKGVEKLLTEMSDKELVNMVQLNQKLTLDSL